MRTEFGEEEQRNDDGGSKGDNTTGKRTAEEIFIDFRVSIQVTELTVHSIHGFLIWERENLEIGTAHETTEKKVVSETGRQQHGKEGRLLLLLQSL